MKYALLITLVSVLIFFALAQMGQEGNDTHEGPVLEFWSYAASGSVEKTTRFWSIVARRFEKENPGVRINTVTDINQGNYIQMLGTRIVAGKPPDVLIIDDGESVRLNMEKLLMPLESFIESDTVYDSNDFPPSMVQDSYVGDIRYSIPWYGAYVCLVYRSDIFEQAGLEPPKTWDDLLVVSRVLQKKYNIEYPLSLSNSVFFTISWLWQNGADILSPDHRKVEIGSPACIKALQFVHDLIYKHRVINPSLTVTGEEQAEKLWAAEKAGMLVSGSWNFSVLDTKYPHLKGKWAVSVLPSSKKDISFYGGQHLVMTRQARHPELAWKFMALATSADIQELWTDIIGSPPANLRTIEKPSFQKNHPYLYQLRNIRLKGRNMPLAPFVAELWYTRFQNSVQDVVMRDPEADIAEVVTRAAKQLQDFVDLYWQKHEYFIQGKNEN